MDAALTRQSLKTIDKRIGEAEDEIATWRKINSQSDPGAMFELRGLRARLTVLKKIRKEVLGMSKG